VKQKHCIVPLLMIMEMGWKIGILSGVPDYATLDSGLSDEFSLCRGVCPDEGMRDSN
jgi:hypothetical protein